MVAIDVARLAVDSRKPTFDRTADALILATGRGGGGKAYCVADAQTGTLKSIVGNLPPPFPRSPSFVTLKNREMVDQGNKPH